MGIKTERDKSSFEAEAKLNSLKRKKEVVIWGYNASIRGFI